MSELFKKAISLGWGLTIVSKEKVEKVVDELVKRGELAPDESKALVNRLIERGEEEQSQFKSVINDQVKKILHEINVPTTSDVTHLEQRIAVLEQRISELEAPQAEQEAPKVE